MQLSKAVTTPTCKNCSSHNLVSNKQAVFSLGCFWGVLHPPIVHMYPLVSVSEAAAPPIRMMACMQS